MYKIKQLLIKFLINFLKTKIIKKNKINYKKKYNLNLIKAKKKLK
jgi:hypothetical protein